MARIGKLKDVIGLAKWTVYDLIKKGPHPVQLRAGRVGWRATDLQRWLNDRPTTDAIPET
ncbi:AlpA family phage regulatory protein [Bordetella avium]|nr:AlpA family transcriptional regulator [Bordetella avium]AZY54211.1 AlpA family transcriptional regulator [Bordetella avium]RIQ14295.1 AlpA family phage regulatory protein [Bordetella avium]RIQ17189.1 AlpA family phage regulatory protein [Bordetella avium]RIQ36644.1 AlpA family phage regulatory protein [Bordetella avium]